ncbi:MAG: [protein-PII] uridylyltransferase, partial [Glaciecola sp.]
MTPLQETLVPLVSDQTTRQQVPSNGAADFICLEASIFDAPAVRTALVDALADLSDAASIRAKVVEILGLARISGTAAIEAAFEAEPLASRRVLRSYARLTDGVVSEIFWVASTYLHPRPSPTSSERMAVMAVGGYGRGEMAPHSDVDLLFILPWKLTGWTESMIESCLYMMWDLRLKVGHASRTIRDCLRLGKEDYTIRTTYLEMRFLTGDTDLGSELQRALRDQLFSGTVGEFIEAKLAERATRHVKQGGQRYMVEPNVKEGKGGLRDL